MIDSSRRTAQKCCLPQDSVNESDGCLLLIAFHGSDLGDSTMNNGIKGVVTAMCGGGRRSSESAILKIKGRKK
jgi:hypothetical protein